MSVCLSICSVLSNLCRASCMPGWSRILTVMINFSCQLDWIWEDDLSMGLWGYFLEELAKGERPPPEWATPSDSIPICRKGNLRGEAELVFPTCLLACSWVHLSTPLLRLQLLSSLTLDPSSLAFQCGLKTHTSARIHKFLSARLELLENPASQTKNLLGSQSFQYEDISCWTLQPVSCEPI